MFNRKSALRMMFKYTLSMTIMLTVGGLSLSCKKQPSHIKNEDQIDPDAQLRLDASEAFVDHMDAMWSGSPPPRVDPQVDRVLKEIVDSGTSARVICSNIGASCKRGTMEVLVPLFHNLGKKFVPRSDNFIVSASMHFHALTFQLDFSQVDLIENHDTMSPDTKRLFGQLSPADTQLDGSQLKYTRQNVNVIGGVGLPFLFKAKVGVSFKRSGFEGVGYQTKVCGIAACTGLAGLINYKMYFHIDEAGSLKFKLPHGAA